MNSNKLENYILREVGKLSRTIHAVVEVKFKELGLQKGQFIYLIRICENPGINLIQLSNMLKVDKTTTTKVIHKLLSKNLVLKKKDTDDKRAFNLYPTEISIDLYNKIIAEENNTIDICFEGFQETEKELIFSLIKRMRINIESDWCKIKNYKS